MEIDFGDKHEVKFHPLLNFLSRIPAIQTNKSPWRGFGTGDNVDGSWWVKFSLDIHHPLAWHAIQELGHVLNFLSINERLPSVFKPVSPPPYMNGGPEDFLSWVIAVDNPTMKPEMIADWLKSRLPNPVDDPAQWDADCTNEES